MERRITVVTREGCHLCDEAMPRVRRAARLLRFAVAIVDVDAAGLADRYGETVPVVLGPGGEELARGRVAFTPLLGSLARLARRI